MNRRTLFAALLAGTALASPALAADLPVRAPAPVVAVAPAYLEEWSGIYVGLEAGFGWGRQRIDTVSVGGFDGAKDIADTLNDGGKRLIFPEFTGLGTDSISQRGGLFGGFAGVQKQLGNWVFGLEVDFDGASIKGSSTVSAVEPNVKMREIDVYRLSLVSPISIPFTKDMDHVDITRTLTINSKIDELGSARGKIGFTAAPNWLIYGTGGLAFAHDTKDIVATESASSSDAWVQQEINKVKNSPRTVTASGGATMLGWALGAGIDWKWTGTGWIFGIEYLHYEFPKHTIALNDGSPSVSVIDTRESVDAIKGRISYLFPIH
jgi:outer membrane immunogenic protein